MSSPKCNSSSYVASTAAKGVVYSILLRLLSFLLSQITIRLIDDPRTLGYSSIQLELLCSTTVLFLSREGFRLSLVRIHSSLSSSTAATVTDNKKNSGNDEKCNKVNNVAWLTIPFGLCLTTMALFIHIYKSHNISLSGNDTENEDIFDYKIAGIYFCIATVIEIISEPCLIHCLRTFNVSVRGRAEGIASIGKALTTVISLYVTQNCKGGEETNSIILYQWIGPVSSFGISQIVYSIIVSTILYQQLRHELYVPNFTNLRALHRQGLDRPALKLSVTFTFQSIFKHLLTEGDRIILSTLVSSYNAGVYAMVSSYGSIVSRMILLPLEENGRLLFSHYHGQINATTKKFNQEMKSDFNNKKYGQKDNNECEREDTEIQLSSSIQELEATYVILVKLVLYIGFVFVSFGFHYTSILLQLLAGSKWGTNRQAIYTLSIYCSYILCMAWNGMTEAFVYGVVDDSVDVGLLSLVHGLVGFVFYILAPWLCLHHGTIGLIFANETCMVLRSLYSMQFAASYFNAKNEIVNQQRREDQHQTKLDVSELKTIFSLSSMIKRFSLFYELVLKVLPPQPVIISFVLSFKITQYSKNYSLENGDSGIITLISLATMTHVCLGLILLMITFITMYRYDKPFFSSLKGIIVAKPISSSVPPKEKSD